MFFFLLFYRFPFSSHICVREPMLIYFATTQLQKNVNKSVRLASRHENCTFTFACWFRHGFGSVRQQVAKKSIYFNWKFMQNNIPTHWNCAWVCVVERTSLPQHALNGKANIFCKQNSGCLCAAFVICTHSPCLQMWIFIELCGFVCLLVLVVDVIANPNLTHIHFPHSRSFIIPVCICIVCVVFVHAAVNNCRCMCGLYAVAFSLRRAKSKIFSIICVASDVQFGCVSVGVRFSIG